MTTRKKRLLLALVFAFSFILVACGSNNSPSTASQSPNATKILPAEEIAGDDNTKSAEDAETMAPEADANEGNMAIF